jgi:WD40 repeat protein
LFTNDAKKLVVGIDKSIHIWDISGSTTSCLLKFNITSKLEHGALSHDGTRFVAVGEYGEVAVWDISGGTATCLQRFETEEDNNDQIALSPDLKMLAIAVEGEIFLWNLASGLRGNVFQRQDGGDLHMGLSFGADSSYIYTDRDTMNLYPPFDAVNVHEPNNPRFPSATYNWDDDWISYGSKKKIWIPLDYRPRSHRAKYTSLWGQKLLIGTKLGKTYFVNFRPHT